MLATSALILAAALPASAAAAPIALDAPGNGSAPQIAFDPTTGTTYVAWSAPSGGGIDLCVLPAGASACAGGAPVVLDNSVYTGDDTPGIAALLVLPGGDAVVIGSPTEEGSVAWLSAPGGSGFFSSSHGIQNGGSQISPVSLFYSTGNAVALSSTDVGVFDDYFDYFEDTSLTAAAPAIASPNANPSGQYPRKALDTNSAEVAAEPAPAPDAAGTDIVVGVGANNGSGQSTPTGCVNYAATGFGVSVGAVSGTSNAAGTLNAAGLPNFGLLACSANTPVLASGGTAGIGALEQEGSGISGAGSDYTLDWHPFIATATGGSFGGAIPLDDVTANTLDGVVGLAASDDHGAGVYAMWDDRQGTVVDYSANGGIHWDGPVVSSVPYGGDNVIAGIGGGIAEIAYDANPGTGDQVFVEGQSAIPVAPPAPPVLGGSGTSDGSTLTITVSCAVTPCTVHVSITADPPATMATRVSADHKKKPKAKTITLASGTFTIKKSGKNELAVKLSKAGKKFLSAHHGHFKGAKLLVSTTIAGHLEKSSRTITITTHKHHKK